jgi:hypothetical protein
VGVLLGVPKQKGHSGTGIRRMCTATMMMIEADDDDENTNIERAMSD